jgi:hypothetical protein
MLLPDRQINGGVGTREACGTEDRRSATSKFAKERDNAREGVIFLKGLVRTSRRRERMRERFTRERRDGKRRKINALLKNISNNSYNL